MEELRGRRKVSGLDLRVWKVRAYRLRVEVIRRLAVLLGPVARVRIGDLCQSGLALLREGQQLLVLPL